MFSAGVDLVELTASAGTPGMLRPFREIFLECAEPLRSRWPSRSSARSTATCVGGALEVALGCDLRIASSDAQLGLPEVKFGIIPDVGGSTRLPAVVGLGRAKELIMTARTIDAAEAERIGLVNRVVAPEELEQATQALVDELLANSHVAVGRAKRVIDASARPTLAQTLEMEVVGAGVLRGGDARERPRGRAGARRLAARAPSLSGPSPPARPRSVWLPSGRPSDRPARPAAQASSAGRSMPVSMPISCSIETRSSLAMLPVAPAGTGQPPSSPKLDSKLVDAGLSAASTLARPWPRVLWKWAVSSTPPSSEAARAKNSRTCSGLAIPVVSPKPISCGAGIAQARRDRQHALGRHVALVGAAEGGRDHPLAAQAGLARARQHALAARRATRRSSG